MYTDSWYPGLYLLVCHYAGVCMCLCVSSFHSSLIYIYVFECVSKFNSVEHLSNGYGVCEIISSETAYWQADA